MTRVVVTESDQHGVLRIVGVGEKPSAGMRHGYIVNKYEARESLIEAVKAAERSCNRRIKKVSATIGGITLSGHILQKNVTTQKRDGLITENDLRKITAMAGEALLEKHPNRQLLHIQASEYRLDGKVMLGTPPAGLHGHKLESRFFAITCLAHHLEDLTDVIQSADLEIEGIYPAPLATYELALKPRQRTAGAVLVDIGAETTTVSVAENNTMISLEVFPIGSSNITNDIALGFQVPLEEAEMIKIGQADDVRYTRRKIDSIVEARLSDIFELVRNHLKKIGRDRTLPGGAVIIGGGSSLTSMEDFAQASLKIPSRVLLPDALGSTRRHITNASWYPAYGVCDLAMRHDNPETSGGFSIGTTIRSIKRFFQQFLP